MKPKKVPSKWYFEILAEYYNGIIHAEKHTMQLTERINNYPTQFDVDNKISLQQLNEWLTNAITPDQVREKINQFREKYTPDKTKQTNLVAAKLEAKIFSLQNSNYSDEENNYNLLHKISNKYYLLNSEMTKLMCHMMKLKLM